MEGLQAIDNMIARLKAFQKLAPVLTMDIMMENEHIIIDMNMEEQLYMLGINSENIPIMRYEPYSPATIFIKNEKRQPTDRVTLRDTGDFHSGGYLERVDEFTVEIKSSDIKSDELQDRYGKEILGLTDDNMDEIKEHYIKPALIKKLHDL